MKIIENQVLIEQFTAIMKKIEAKGSDVRLEINFRKEDTEHRIETYKATQQEIEKRDVTEILQKQVEYNLKVLAPVIEHLYKELNVSDYIEKDILPEESHMKIASLLLLVGRYHNAIQVAVYENNPPKKYHTHKFMWMWILDLRSKLYTKFKSQWRELFDEEEIAVIRDMKNLLEEKVHHENEPLIKSTETGT